MKHILFIDGENFFHGLVDTLKSQRIIRDRRGLQRINILDVMSVIPRDEARYYATSIQLPSTSSNLFKTVESMRKWNARWAPYLANQRIKFISAGMLRVKQSKRCRNCGVKTDVLIEKGVDVRLAVDMVTAAGKGKTLYMFSSDSDLLPALAKAQEIGSTVVYIAFESRVNFAIQRMANKTIIIPKATIAQAFKKVNI